MRRIRIGIAPALVMQEKHAGRAGQAREAGMALAAAVAGIGGAFALARAWWAASTKRARQRIGEVIEAVGKAAGQSDGPA